MIKHQKSILLVDDDPDLAESLSTVLRARGYRVHWAADGKSGVRVAKSERPDLILMDIVMRERTEGLFAVQEIRHTPGLEGTPIFIITSLYGGGELQVPPESGWTGHDAFFSKPIDPVALLAAVEHRIGLAEEIEDENPLTRMVQP